MNTKIVLYDHYMGKLLHVSLYISHGEETYADIYNIVLYLDKIHLFYKKISCHYYIMYSQLYTLYTIYLKKLYVYCNDLIIVLLWYIIL